MAKQSKSTNKIKRSFHQDLILNQWLISLFDVNNLAELKRQLGDKEGIEENGQTTFFNQLSSRNLPFRQLRIVDLRRYDLNIIQHWKYITEKRNEQEEHILTLKYFQYLSLLFSEIYLDWYFNQPEVLLDALNQYLIEQQRLDENTPKFSLYSKNDLNKLAFWSATGSGKTLLMHVNILQYQYYSQLKDLQIFVLTPNEGLTKQHLNDLLLSNFQATLFDKNNYNFDLYNTIQLIDINKLNNKEGDKTVSVEAFEGGNKLVLVDEGHRGNSSEAKTWIKRRNQLIGNGFAFEYSATFGQAVKERKTVADLIEDERKNKAKLLFGSKSIKGLNDIQLAQVELSELEQSEIRQFSSFETYAKSILFDYSYKFFYQDGYGKENLILNMKAEYYQHKDNAQLYFIACLLSFYQQIYIFEKYKTLIQLYHFKKPLLIFVGAKVNDDDSDILQVLEHFAFFLNADNKTKIFCWLENLLNDRAELLNNKGESIFNRHFQPLKNDWDQNIQDLYQDMIKKLFNANNIQRLQLVNLKKANGELALRLGNEKPFGVINIGDDSKFFNQVSNNPSFDNLDDAFSEGIFHYINNEHSTVNVLIGSRKFSEGWSSWRVSTMGLLNMGRNEGTQIIQLFGRGVRLKGKDFSLKRSGRKDYGLNKLETLNIFGVKADYMAKFKEYLVEEDINTEEMITLDFPIKKNLPHHIKLKTLVLKEGYKDNQANGFKRKQFIHSYEIPEKWKGKIKPIKVVLDLYPKLEALSSTKMSYRSENDVRNEGKLNVSLFPLFDWEKIYLKLLNHKLYQTWSNLCLDKQKLRSFAEKQQDWYQLYIPESKLLVNNFNDVLAQQEILIQLLILYTDKFYYQLKTLYESDHYIPTEVTEQNSYFIKGYQFEFDNEKNVEYDLKNRLEQLKILVEKGLFEQAQQWRSPFNQLTAICFKHHLYYPLFRFNQDEEQILKISPLLLKAESEQKFIEDLINAEISGQLMQWIGDKHLYLMRNADNKMKGLGFTFAGNFYPDFLLWLVDPKTHQQWLSFIDPKGIRQMDLETDPKFGLYKEIKQLEAKIADPDLILSSFILSITKQQDLINASSLETEDFYKKHILFMSEADYLTQMFTMILENK